MSRDNLDLSGNSGAAEQQRQRAHTPTRGSILHWLARPTRIAALAALGLTLGLLSVAYSQQAPLPPAVAAPTPSAAIAQQAASPEAVLAFADAATPTPGPIAVGEALPAAVEALSDEAASPPAFESATIVPPTEEPIVDQDELLAELRPQLSARGGLRVDGSAGATGEPAEPAAAPASELATQLFTTALAKTAAAATKTPTPRPVVKVATKTPTPRPVVKTVVKTATKVVVKTPVKTATAVVSSSTIRARAVSIALRYIGYRYTYGGISPSTGFDCSGFVYYVYKAAGRPIPRSLGSQYSTGVWVSRANLQPGDLVFFKNTYRAGLSHAALYIGGGRFVHARSETTGVTTNSFDTYWSGHYLGARRP